MALPTAEQVTNKYLYDQTTTPTHLPDEQWIRPKSDVGVRTRQAQKLTIWPSCLGEFDWPKVGEFEVPIRAKNSKSRLSKVVTQLAAIHPHC